jgi:hypothetical protein
MGGASNHIVSRLPLRDSWRDPEAGQCCLDLALLKPPAPQSAAHPAPVEIEYLANLDNRIRDHRHLFPVSAAAAVPTEGLLAIGLPGGWQIRLHGDVIADALHEQPTSLCFEKENGRTHLLIASLNRIQSYSLNDGACAGGTNLLRRITAVTIDSERGEAFCAQNLSGQAGSGSAIVAVYQRKGALDLSYRDIYKSEKAVVTALALWPGRNRCLAIGLSSGEIEVRRIRARGENGDSDLLFTHRLVQNAPVTALNLSSDRILLAADGLGGVHEIDFRALPVMKAASSSTRSARLRGAVRALAAGHDGAIHTYFGSRCG